MTFAIRLVFATFVILFATSCALKSRAPRVFQVNTLAGFLDGKFEGALTVSELQSRGDFGVGTFQALDGEMVVLDGVVYQSDELGQLRSPSPTLSVPLAAVVNWHADRQFDLEGAIDLPDLGAKLQPYMTNCLLGCAFRIEGRFAHISLRSVRKQDKPFPNISQVVKNQAEYQVQDVDGTLVGFWFGPAFKSIHGDGFHFHFVSANRTSGGHVLGLKMQQARVGLMNLDRTTLQMSYPERSN